MLTISPHFSQHLQWTITGAKLFSRALISLILAIIVRMTSISSGIPWSGQPVYWNWVTIRRSFSPSRFTSNVLSTQSSANQFSSCWNYVFIFLILNTSLQLTETSWHKGRDFTESIIFKDSDFAILQRADLMVIFKEFRKLFWLKLKHLCLKNISYI